MREIKFRAWDNLHKQITYDWLFIEEGAGQIYLKTTVGSPAKYTNVMQYTELKDKNGKEIYEGDICKDDYNHTGIIRFGKGFQGEPADGVYPYYGWCFGEGETTAFGDDDLIILGNIYENPGLLEEK